MGALGAGARHLAVGVSDVVRIDVARATAAMGDFGSCHASERNLLQCSAKRWKGGEIAMNS